ncbi:hypothetical protein Hs30E_16200 [Lactococcus hodotermopsidis]|uniref:Type I restriction enzyme R protein C-terminal domain-containing protein n=1 Tax=Pseudolactococcus hodotermopsidis TaxID=2709157 RepID=A0A6A0BCD5_9LACT|nr:hypothetical protein [Lactococcus hodotermopsidis]GFH43069.1 hypothetical protein Hs30E_16200 [Lactococcus hodotermopsidis]
MQDMKSVYVGICDEILKSKGGRNGRADSDVDFSDIEFQINLLKTDEINLDYILVLILEKFKQHDDLDRLKIDIRRIIRSSFGTRAKETLIIDFINETDLFKLTTTDAILAAFYSYANEQKEVQIKKLAEDENLKEESTRFIEKSISKGHVDSAGAELDSILPPTSRRRGARESKKQTVLQKIQELVEVFIGI